MKKIYTIVFALMVLLSITMSAAALQSKTIYRQNGLSATADWSEKTNDGIKDTYLNVMNTKDGTDIAVSICTSDATGNYSCKFGYTSTQENVFNMDTKLVSAALSAVQVDLFDWSNPNPVVETITIKAQWTGVGDITKSSYQSISKFNGIISKYSDSSSIRQATATGSINDQDLGITEYAGLIKFKDASIWMQK